MSRILCRRLIFSVFPVFAFFVCSARVQAAEISGTISTTLTIYDDSELVGDVKCMVAGNPCIDFGASGIKLRLNGFTITENITGCTSATSLQDGIDVGDVVSLHDVAILGPGLVQKFGGFGIGIFGSSKVRVEGVTASDNCFSGIILVGSMDSDIERNVFVRNSSGSEGAPCGGT
jgi:parallel beta-helix repeat protein